jgi:NADH dehydrogenase/NADH:ubiquinone oxidoreductase subunit G
MTDALYRNFERLVEIEIRGRKFQVPENNTCLRAFQFVSPETIPYGRFCWNQECQLCRVTYKLEGQPDAAARPVLACKVLVAEGMQIIDLSDELKWALARVLRGDQPQPAAEPLRDELEEF